MFVFPLEFFCMAVQVPYYIDSKKKPILEKCSSVQVFSVRKVFI